MSIKYIVFVSALLISNTGKGGG
ncbi:fimbrial protein, partial [Shigella flexneri]|nr:fimbrial protein [Shigella flexneri]